MISENIKNVDNAIGSYVQLQHRFNESELELILGDMTLAPSGYPVIFAYKYGTKIVLENLMGIVLNTIVIEEVA